MKTILAICALSLISACATPGATSAKSPAQSVTAFCGPAQSIIAVLKSDTSIAASGQAVLSKTAPQVATICSAASAATSNDLQSLTSLVESTVFPIAEATHPELVPDIIAAQAILGIVEANIPSSTK